jgi:hypothetical protein
MGTALVTIGFVVIVFGTIALGLWALRRHNRQFPKGTRVRSGERKPSGIETKTTWLSGGHS